jgi:hypothetical protein
MGPLLPGYRIYEYLLVLNPHEELRNKIMAVKNEFYETYTRPKRQDGANRILRW